MTVSNLTSPPTPTPQRTQTPAVFRPAADAFVAWQASTFTPEINDAIDQFNADFAIVETNKNTAEAAKEAAEAAQAATEAASTATEWQSGGTYAAGDVVWSPTDYQSYRNKTGTNTTTDPFNDDTNWQIIGAVASRAMTVSGGTTLPSAGLFRPDNSAGAISLTLPASPFIGDRLRFRPVFGTSYSDNNVTLLRNGNLIQAVADDLVIDTDNVMFELEFVGSTTGWTVLRTGTMGDVA